jgi:hypothetical protein
VPGSRIESLHLVYARLKGISHYWHACTATVHIAPAHLGAAIEALQRAYVGNHPGPAKIKILDRPQSKQMREALSRVIDDANISEDSKQALKDNLPLINRLPQRTVLQAVMRAIGIELSRDEFDAWQRRNDAAHGKPVPEGEELAAIREMKLLRGLFNRMLLRITNGADSYVDYVSPNHPHRSLKEPPTTRDR